MAKLLLQNGADVECQGYNTEISLLYNAAKNGHFEMTQLLLEHNASLTFKDKDGLTPYEIADVDCLDVYELPPLYNAIVNNHLEIVKLFIEHGAYVNLGHMSSNTNLLFHAMRKGHTEIAKLLIDNGANVNAKLRNSQGLYFTLEFPKRIRIVKRRIRIPFFQTILDIRITDIRIFTK